nr:hypothetical protein [Tanacetum cinerariifolium]GEV89005.1 hypothetical protein [Tanacetum cinerariifolium]
MDSGKKKEIKAITFHMMETEEVYECYITLCFVEGEEKWGKVVNWELLVALKGELYFFSFVINLDEDYGELGVIFGHSFLKVTKAIVYFGNGIFTIYPNIINFNSDDEDELDAILASINVEYLPPLDISYFPPFVCNIGKNLRKKNKPSKNYKMSYDDKLKLDGEFELEDEMVGEELIRDFKGIKEKSDPRVLVLLIHLEGKYDYRALVDTGSNINMMPYSIYELLEEIKLSHC